MGSVDVKEMPQEDLRKMQLVQLDLLARLFPAEKAEGELYPYINLPRRGIIEVDGQFVIISPAANALSRGTNLIFESISFISL